MVYIVFWQSKSLLYLLLQHAQQESMTWPEISSCWMVVCGICIFNYRNNCNKITIYIRDLRNVTWMFWALLKMNICIECFMIFISEQQKNVFVSMLCFLDSKFEMGMLNENRDFEGWVGFLWDPFHFHFSLLVERRPHDLVPGPGMRLFRTYTPLGIGTFVKHVLSFLKLCCL